ncbi:LptF/LptG family permease [Rickettsiales bacterium]|nr:LptF/LptG family permease [Rickettsiales bacterium]
MFCKINLYLIKQFLQRFIFITCAISVLIIVFNLFDLLDAAGGVPLSTSFLLAILQLPNFIREMFIFFIMISVMTTFYSLSLNNEITIMRSSGLSLFKIILPISVAIFVIGIILITIFNEIVIISDKKYQKIEKSIKKDVKDSFIYNPDEGIWFKQSNFDNAGGKIIFRSNSANSRDIIFYDVKIWFFDEDNKFYQKIDAAELSMKGQYFIAKNVKINDDKLINKYIADFSMRTDLTPEFIKQKISTNFSNIKSFSIFELPYLIEDMKNSGYSTRKFQIYYHFLLSKPFLLIAISFISLYFTIVNARNKNNIINFVIGIIISFLLYIFMSISYAFGASGFLPFFVSSWLFTVIILAISILLLIIKDHSYLNSR